MAKTLEILGDNRFPAFTKTRVACRGIVIREGKILLSREENADLWLIPGGGLEGEETIEACCAREILEETGYIVRPEVQFLILREYYGEYCYVSHYFTCAVTGKGAVHLTEEERRRGLVPRWIPWAEALSIFSRHADYAPDHEEKRGAYLREYTALLEYAAQFPEGKNENEKCLICGNGPADHHRIQDRDGIKCAPEFPG